ncbi:hypothetical protein ALP52_00829 [Pseudomonas amygdali pv. mori]|uniref:Uncharacterized protein n=1 Tax=Pseudomonas amygdali pv. mori TaxID=34065 RepID=A0A3M5IMU4_PSEA0|nr:hypothetical protein [Pseudomonas amygdali]RMT12415.1 hypothetical protein ALP52_00829 [Pseudomonas amygdali pv. mori]
MNILNTPKSVAAWFASDKSLFPVIANISIFFFMTKGMEASFNNYLEVAALLVIANVIFHLTKKIDTDKIARISFYAFAALLISSKFFQLAFDFSFVDWLVTFTEFHKQAPMTIFGLLAFVGLPIAAGHGLNKYLTAKKNLKEA